LHISVFCTLKKKATQKNGGAAMRRVRHDATPAGLLPRIAERPTPTPENRHSSLSATTRKIHNDTPL